MGIKIKPNFTIVGAGLFGSICANKLANAGFKVKVIERRGHIGGNCFTENKDNIDIHKYGPHIFHTSNDFVWEYINRFTTFNNFKLSPVAEYKGDFYSLPFNMWTFNKIWKVNKPHEAQMIINSFMIDHPGNPDNLESKAIQMLGQEVYEKLIYGYTYKQWGREPKTLPKEIIERLPIRLTYDNNYFNDKYQGIPSNGYTEIFVKLLSHKNITVFLNRDFNKERNRDEFIDLEKGNTKIIYTGPIDKYFGCCFGELDYKSSSFVHEKHEEVNKQGCAVINYTELEIPYTRTIEHKHFNPEKTSNVTWVTTEYPDHTKNTNPAYLKEPMYPVNDKSNNEIYAEYKNLSEGLKGMVYFGGRLAEYKYYDMDDTILSALHMADNIVKENN